jgi:hypothetical protein
LLVYYIIYILHINYIMAQRMSKPYYKPNTNKPLPKSDLIKIEDFPKIELSYETHVHNKVPSHYAVAVPMGKKMFAWFTVHNEQNVCLLVDPLSLRTAGTFGLTQFDTSLCFGEYGTLVYGTIVNYNQSRFFNLEDIFFYKGRNVSKEFHIEKLGLFKQMMDCELGKYAFNNKCIVFGLPAVHTSHEDLAKMVSLLPYKMYSVQFYYFNRREIYSIKYATFCETGPAITATATAAATAAAPVTVQKTLLRPTYNQSQTQNQQQPQTKIFNVTADLQPDIYYLQSSVPPQQAKVVAYIPNYDTSAMMNKLFRNIKENANLDALEESDDEEEFENNQLDKYVFLDRTYKMECVYNYKFKKWVPQKVV